MDSFVLISVIVPIGFGLLSWGLSGYARNMSPILHVINLMLIGIALGTDRITLQPISLSFFILSALTGLCVSLAARRLPDSHRFNGLLWITIAGLNLVYTSASLLGFYFGWEIALIPALIMIWNWGNDQRGKSGTKFLIYTVIGSIAMLGAIVYIYQTTGALSWIRIGIGSQTLGAQWALFLGFFIAFAIKTPLFLFHGWQSDTYNDSPAPTSMLLSAIFSKMGIYGFFKLTTITAPFLLDQLAPGIVLIGIIGAIFGAAMAFGQSNFKRVIAFSSLSHLNLVVAAIFAAPELSRAGALLLSISHVILSLGLWWAVGILETRWKHVHLDKIAFGIATESRWFSGFFFIIMLSAMAVPLTAGFPGEFLVIQGLLRYNLLLGTLACIPVILGAVYVFRCYHRIMFTEISNDIKPTQPLMGPVDFAFGLAIVCLILIIGVAPSVVFLITGAI